MNQINYSIEGLLYAQMCERYDFTTERKCQEKDTCFLVFVWGNQIVLPFQKPVSRKLKIKKNIFLFRLVTRIWMLFDEYNKVDTSYKSWWCSGREYMKMVIEFMAKWDGKIVKEVCP